MYISKHKGFTLIELMAVVIILGIISTITVVTINYSIKNAKNKLFGEQVVRLQNSVKEWSVSNTSLLPTDETGISFFSINRLLEEGVIATDQVIDPRDNKELEGCLTIKYNEEYSQYVYEYIDQVCDTVVDSYKPTLTVVGGIDQNIEVNGVLSLPVVTAKDYKNNALIVSGPTIRKGNTIVSSIKPTIVGDVYTLTYSTTDTSLNLTTTKVVNLTVNDTTKPNVCVIYNGENKCSSFNIEYQSLSTFIPPASVVTDNSCGLNGTDTTVNNCDVTLNAVVSGSVNPLVPGNYNVTYLSTDKSGNISNPLIITVKVVDLVPPTIAIYDMKVNSSTGSAYTSGWTNQNVWVGNILATDTGVGVEKYQYSLDCQNSWTDISGSQVYTSEVNTTSYCIRAIDYDGNISETVNKTMKIDKTAPIAGVLSMKLGTSAGSAYTNNTWTNQNVWINENNGSDALSGHASTAYTVTGATSISSTTTESTLSNNGTATATLTTTDNAGNTATNTYTIKVDTVVPSTPSIAGGNTSWKNTNASLTVTAGTDATSGVATTEYSTDNATWTTYASALSYTSDTNITLYARTKDNAANISTVVSTTVKIDKTVPSLSISGGNTTWKNTNSSVSLSSSDSGSGLASTQYSTDNVNWTTYASALSYTSDTNITLYAKATDTAGNVSTTSTTVKVDKTAPSIPKYVFGGMKFIDPTFALGNNSLWVYNNLGNGTVGHTREAMTTPVGSYAMKIVTSGAATPGVGGFYQTVTSSASRKYYHRFIAKIPVGYTAEYAANLVSDAPIWTWLTSNAGTGDWQEYVYTLETSATGTFSTFGYVYLNGAAGTPTVPVTWYVAYSTIIADDQWGASNSIGFKGSDALSGVTGYGVNTSATVAPTFTTVPSTNNLGTHYANITSNAAYYLWITDAAGNTANQAFTISKVDNVAPVLTISGANPYEITVGNAFTEPGRSATDNSGFTPTITNTTIPTAVGSYTITYTATDIAGNTATGTRSFYIWSAWSAYSTTVVNPTTTVEVQTKKQQRSRTRTTFWSTSSSLAGYTATGARSTNYSGWSCSVNQWDMCAPGDYNKTVTYGGYLNQQTSYYWSPGSNGWWCQGSGGCGLVSTYSHTRCGLSVTYKYTCGTSGACNTAYTEEKCTRSFSDTWQYYDWTAFGSWADVTTCSTDTADIDYECQTLYSSRNR